MARYTYMRKLKTRLRRLLSRRKGLLVCIAIGALVLGWVVMSPKQTINTAAYAPLLEVIAKGESEGNYNAYFSNAGNSHIKFTEMTIAEVLVWQKEFVEQGSASNAVGRYQIIHPTLESLVRTLGLNQDELFDETLQDSLAIALMERRGSIALVKNELTAPEFAHNLSQEWAALPRVKGDEPEKSFYSGDGLNESRIRSESILSAIEAFKMRAAS